MTLHFCFLMYMRLHITILLPHWGHGMAEESVKRHVIGRIQSVVWCVVAHLAWYWYYWWVQITPEIYWQEADFSSNIIVNNNIFDSYYGGITLGGFLDGSYAPGQFPNHYNVTISGNIIRVSFLPRSHWGLQIINARFEALLTCNAP